jgi:hypothetical protein
MFDDPSPEEKAHGDLCQALEKLDVDAVRAICQSYPGVEQPRNGWTGSPMQRLLNRHLFSFTPEKMWPCMDVLVEYGAKLQQGHSYMPSPLNGLLKHADLRTLRHLHETGVLKDAIKDGVGGDRCLHFVCTSTQWRDRGRDYPLLEMVTLLLEAGDDYSKGLYTDGPALTHLLRGANPSYGFAVPNSIEDTLLLLMEHDQKTAINPSHLVQAFRGNLPKAFNQLAKRYAATLEADELATGMNEGLHDVCAKMKPEDKASFEAWWIQSRTAAPTATTSADARRMRI